MDERVDLLVKMADMQNTIMENMNRRVSQLERMSSTQTDLTAMILEKLGWVDVNYDVDENDGQLDTTL